MRNWLIFVFLLFGLFSCSSGGDVFTPYDIPRRNVNNQITLSVKNGWNTFRYEDLLAVDIHTHVKGVIEFEYDYGVRIFVLGDMGWEEVEIPVSEQVNQDPVRVLGGTTLYGFFLAQFPQDRPNYLTRVFIRGVIAETGRPVAAYIDIVMSR